MANASSTASVIGQDSVAAGALEMSSELIRINLKDVSYGSSTRAHVGFVFVAVPLKKAWSGWITASAASINPIDPIPDECVDSVVNPAPRPLRASFSGGVGAACDRRCRATFNAPIAASFVTSIIAPVAAFLGKRPEVRRAPRSGEITASRSAKG
jgi:hypothetical protein